MVRTKAFLFPAAALALLALVPSCKPADPIVIRKRIDVEPAGSEPAATPLPAELTFNEHVQPILSENCYQCHGPDANTREPKDNPLRLDLAEEAVKPRENGKPVIVAGDPGASLFVKLLHSEKPSEIMPPPESH